MRFVCISDTHSLHRMVKVPDGDVLLIAGDVTSRGRVEELEEFNEWVGTMPHEFKVVVAGNHDFVFEKFLHTQQWDYSISRTRQRKLTSNFIYLMDSWVDIGGFKIYGSPWQPRYFDWAFNVDRGSRELRKIWDMIPIDTEILVTHSPPHGILDQNEAGEHCGCELLAQRVKELPGLRLQVYGHIHEAAGQVAEGKVTYVNASTCDLKYRPVNPPIAVDL
jgi:Icc-related predicted phosphoesterase